MIKHGPHWLQHLQHLQHLLQHLQHQPRIVSLTALQRSCRSRGKRSQKGPEELVDRDLRNPKESWRCKIKIQDKWEISIRNKMKQVKTRLRKDTPEESEKKWTEYLSHRQSGFFLALQLRQLMHAKMRASGSRQFHFGTRWPATT